jgi:hypothetical protein
LRFFFVSELEKREKKKKKKKKKDSRLKIHNQARANAIVRTHQLESSIDIFSQIL